MGPCRRGGHCRPRCGLAPRPASGQAGSRLEAPGPRPRPRCLWDTVLWLEQLRRLAPSLPPEETLAGASGSSAELSPGGQLGKRAVLINLALGPCPDTGLPHDQSSSFLIVNSVVKDFLIVLFSSLLVKPVLMMAQLLPWLPQLVSCYLLQPTPQQSGSS